VHGFTRSARATRGGALAIGKEKEIESLEKANSAMSRWASRLDDTVAYLEREVGDDWIAVVVKPS
jgi:hypothetical protein